ncbi:hypothetical protein NIES2101_25735 [Calothrix sp. HK-06]|nr:hypothetical protein NIES2101_25735 [Calothrix sp. HK-06]
MDFITTTVLEYLLSSLWLSTSVSLVTALVVGAIVGVITRIIARRQKALKKNILAAITGAYIGSLLGMLLVTIHMYSLRNSGPYAGIILLIVIPIYLLGGSIPGAIAGVRIGQSKSIKFKSRKALIAIGTAYSIIVLACIVIVEKPPLPQFIRANAQEQSKSLIGTFIGHADNINSLAFTPDGQTLISSGHDQTIRFWDIKNWKLLKTIRVQNQIRDIAISPDGQTLVGSGLYLDIWQLKPIKQVRRLTGEGICSQVTISRSGEFVACITGYESPQKEITIWRLKTGEEVKTLKEESQYGFFNNIAISPDEKTLVSSGNGVVKIWEFPTGKILKVVKMDETVDALTIHPSSKTFITLGSNIEIRQIDQGTLVRKLPSIQSEGHLALSPDGKILASLYTNKILNFWEASTGKQLQSWRDVGDRTIAISPDNRIIATDLGKAIKIWWLP